MSNDAINPAGAGTEALPASTPEYAPVTQVVVEDVPAGETHTAAVETPPTPPLPDSSPYLAPREPEPQETPTLPVTPTITETSDAPTPPVTPPVPVPPVAPAHLPTTSAVSTPVADASPEKRIYDLLFEEFSRDPRFELHTNIRALMQEVQAIKAMTPQAARTAATEEDITRIRETVEKIWTRLEEESVGAQFITPSAINAPSAVSTPNSQPSTELIAETRALVRSVNEEINATRNSVIQLTNQGRMMLDVATRCLREMDKTALHYEKQGETNPLLDELRSLRDMLADGFENARLEPITPEPGETFRYSDHRADNGSASSGKIKRTVFPGFRWTQPNPPVVLMPAIVETE